MIEDPRESSFFNNPVTRTLFEQTGFSSKDFTKRFLVETLLGSGLNFVASFGQNLGKVQQDKLNLMKENKNLAINQLKDVYNSPKNNKNRAFYQSMIDDPTGTKDRLIAEDFKYSQIQGIPRGVTLADIQNDSRYSAAYDKWRGTRNEIYEKRFKEFSENDFITSPSLSETKKYQSLISNFSNNYAELKNDPKYSGALPWLIETIKDKFGESAAAEVEMVGEIKAGNLVGEVQKQTDFENNLLDNDRIITERKEFARNPVSTSSIMQNITAKQQEQGKKVAADFQNELFKKDRDNKFSRISFEVFSQEDFEDASEGNYNYEKGGASETMTLLNRGSLNKMIVKEFDPKTNNYIVSEEGAASALAKTIGVIHAAHYDDMVREDQGVIPDDSFVINTVKTLVKERRIVDGPNGKLVFYVPNDNDLKREYKRGLNDFERLSHVVSFGNKRKGLKTLDEVFLQDNILQLKEFQRRKSDTRVGFEELEKLNVEIDKRRNVSNQEMELLKLDLLINTPQYLRGQEIQLSENKIITLGEISKADAQLFINKYETKEFEGGKVKAPEYLRKIVDELPSPSAPTSDEDGQMKQIFRERSDFFRRIPAKRIVVEGSPVTVAEDAVDRIAVRPPLLAPSFDIFSDQKTGEEATNEAIDLAIKYGPDKETAKVFLNEIAKVESEYGNAPNTFGKPDSKGHFQIDEVAFNEVQRRLEGEKEGQTLRDYNEKFMEDNGLDLRNVSYDELDGRGLNAVFARLYLMRFTDELPTTLEARANYWKNNYNTKEGAGSVNRYIEVIKR